MKKNSIKRNIKRILLIMTGLILVIIFVLLFNTIRFKSKQLQTTPIPKVDVSKNAVIHLSQSIQFKTISYENITQFDSVPFLKFLDFLKKTYPQINTTLEKRLINNYNILYKWNGKNPNKKSIILTAHYDVVPVEKSTLNQWIEKPFGGKIDDSFIWGRGTMDDKLAVIGIMEAIKMLLNEGFKPEKTIYIAFGYDEEIGGLNGAKKIVELLKHNNVRAEFVLDEGLCITRKIVDIEKDVALIGLSEKGYLSVELSLDYEGGHASMPQKETTIDILAQAIVKLRVNQPQSRICEPVEKLMEYIGPEMSFTQKLFLSNRWLFEGVILNMYAATPTGNSLIRTTTAPTIFKSGIKDNILPTSASATLNFRILPGETVEDVISHIKDVIDDERIIISLGDIKSNPSPVSSTESFGFKVVEKTIKQIFPDILVSPSLVNGATDSRHYATISDDVYRFSPQTVTTEDLPRFHGINERLNIEDFKDCCRFYYQLIKNSVQY
ncbi:MAG: M20 family peptidase [Calditrichales bacterium]|nr:M20 family peptidase [Calditrichales bacterium]